MRTRNPWTVLGSDQRYANPWIEVTHHEVLNPHGRPGIYGVVSYRNTAVGVLPIAPDGTTWLVGQYRFPLKQWSWEIPEGGSPVGGDPQAAARRELQEETGLRAGMLRELMQMHLSNSTSDEHAIAYLAWDLTEGEAAPEDTEELRIRRLPFAEALAMAMDGRITDAISVAAMLKLRVLLDRGAAPPPVQAALAGGNS